jgi:hypothetical protein
MEFWRGTARIRAIRLALCFGAEKNDVESNKIGQMFSVQQMSALEVPQRSGLDRSTQIVGNIS